MKNFTFHSAFIFLLTFLSNNTFAQLSGTYTIDNSIGASSTNYTSFTSAISDLNSGARTDGGTAHGPGVSANVTFNVTSGETFTEDPLIITYVNGSGYSITFQKYGTSANPIIYGNGSGGTTDAIVQINSGDKYTFDGIDLTAGNNTVEYGIFLSGSASDGCQNNTFQNSTITLDKTNGHSTYGVYVNSAATGSGGRNSNNHFYNNTVTDVGTAGYYILGNGTYLDDGNQIGTTGAGVSQVTNFGVPGTFAQMYGIYEAYQTNIQVFNTRIDNSSFTGDSISCITVVYGIENYSAGGLNTADIYGNTICNIANGGTLGGSSIEAIYSQALTINIHDNVITNLYHRSSGVLGILANESPGTTSIYNNKIYNLSADGAGSSINGIATQVIVSTLNVYNNMVYDLRANNSSAGFGVRGIWVNSATSAAHVYYNTVYLNGTSANSSFQSAALFQAGSTVATLDLRDNILYNAYNVTTGTRAVAFYRANATYSNLASTSNNNLLYAGTPGSKNLLLYDGTNSEQTLSNYKSFINSQVSGAEQNSVTGDPVLVSETGTINVHLLSCGGGPALNAGTPISGYTTDIDGDTRDGSNPDIGADETYSVASHPGIDSTICSGLSITIGASPTATGGTSPYAYSWSPSTGLSYSTVANPSANPTATTTYTLIVTDHNGCTSTSNISITVNSLPITPVVTASGATIFCAGSSVTLTAASGYSGYLWSNGATTQSIVASETGSFMVQGIDANGCYSANDDDDEEPNVIELTPSATIQPGTLSVNCYGTYSVVLTANAGTSYSWSSSETTQAITVTSTSYHYVTVTDANGCTATSTIIYTK